MKEHIQEPGRTASGNEDPRVHLRSLEIVAIVAQQGLWWIVYRARGQRCGILSEGGVSPHSSWLYPILACADEEVRMKDVHIDLLLGPLR